MLTMNEKIYALRHRHKLTQGELAARLKMTIPTFAGREKGETSWRLDELNTMAEIFGVTVKDLLSDCDNEIMQ